MCRIAFHCVECCGFWQTSILSTACGLCNLTKTVKCSIAFSKSNWRTFHCLKVQSIHTLRRMSHFKMTNSLEENCQQTIQTVELIVPCECILSFLELYVDHVDVEWELNIVRESITLRLKFSIIWTPIAYHIWILNRYIRIDNVIHCESEYNSKCLHFKVIIASINLDIATMLTANANCDTARSYTHGHSLHLCKSLQFTLNVHQTNECHKLAKQFNITVFKWSAKCTPVVAIQKRNTSFSLSPSLPSSSSLLVPAFAKLAFEIGVWTCKMSSVDKLFGSTFSFDWADSNFWCLNDLECHQLTVVMWSFASNESKEFEQLDKSTQSKFILKQIQNFFYFDLQEFSAATVFRILKMP